MRFFIFLFVVLAAPAFCTAQTSWYVPDDFSTIQGAINDASVVNGDTVIVRPGTYYELINYSGKAIAVKSEQGPDMTFIDGYQLTGAIVTFQSSEGSDSILEGFTITNGSFSMGGGVYCANSSPTIMKNFIVGNVAQSSYGTGCGGGIHCSNSSPNIIDNKITNNLALGHSSGWGGGIYCISDSSPSITGNTITLNGAYYGGGIYCDQDSSPNIVNNIIKENAAHYNGGGLYGEACISPCIKGNSIAENSANNGDGGGIYLKVNGTVTIEKNIIRKNIAWTGGAGICCLVKDTVLIKDNSIMENICHSDGGGVYFSGGSLEFINNIIVGNSTSAGGGGLYCQASVVTIVNNTMAGNMANTGGAVHFGPAWAGDFTMMNTILWHNSAMQGQEIYMGDSWFGSTLTVDYSNVEGGQNSVYLDSNCTLNWGAAMIDADPLFVDFGNGDTHLTFNSPCRDAGDNTVPILPDCDCEDDPRIAYSTVDMGADEFHPHLYYTGNAIPGGNLQLKVIGQPSDIINGIILGMNIFNPPLSCDYGLWYMDNPFQIMTGFGAIPANGVKVFPGTIAATPPAPYTFYLQAVIDMWLTNICTVNVQ